ncbi:MAG: hypothetical protein ABEJ60_06945 [Halodesulfurarchaeum sp.]
MDLAADTTVLDGSTLVSVVLGNPHEQAARFRLENALDGPVWPPRRRGYPESGWDETGYEGHIEPGGHLALGYATSASPAPEPVTLAWVEPAEQSADLSAEGATAGETARSFRDPRPPRSVLGPPAPRPGSMLSAEEES